MRLPDDFVTPCQDMLDSEQTLIPRLVHEDLLRECIRFHPNLIAVSVACDLERVVLLATA